MEYRHGDKVRLPAWTENWTVTRIGVVDGIRKIRLSDKFGGNWEYNADLPFIVEPAN